jgi:hypothetical protein
MDSAQLRAATYVFSNIVQDVRFEGHVHVDGSRDPAQLTLSHIQDPLNLSCRLSTDDDAREGGSAYGLDGGFDLGEAKEVHVTKLLLIRPVLGQVKRVQWLVAGLVSLKRLFSPAPEMNISNLDRVDFGLRANLTMGFGVAPWAALLVKPFSQNLSPQCYMVDFE